MPTEEKEEAVAIPVEEEEKKKKETKKEKKAETEDELSVEDQKLKDRLDLLVERITEARPADADQEEQDALQMNALESLRTEIRSSTSSMTSVPKPLKFLTPHYPAMKEYRDKMASGPNKVFLNDILSVMGMTMAEDGTRESLQSKLKGTVTDLGSWGHEYVRHLCGEIATEWHQRVERDEATEDLVTLIDQIIPFKVQHKREFEAVDLLIDVDLVSRVVEVVTSDNCQAVCKYTLACADYLGDPDEHKNLLTICFRAFLKFKFYADALRVAIKVGQKDMMIEVFETVQDCKMEDLDDDDSDDSDDSDEDEEDGDKMDTEEKKERNPDPDCDLIRKQLCYILGAQNIVLEELESQEDLMAIMGNCHYNKHFLGLAAELDVKEAKRPEDIYKTHLVEGHGRTRRHEKKSTGPTHDSAKKNLADTFVNAFVNCGFGTDTLMTPEGSEWVYKNRGHGMLSAAASMGMLMLWDIETGFNAIDIFSFSPQNNIKAGGLLATGIISASITSDMDVALGLLSEHIEDGKDNTMKTAAVLGLGIAYAGSAREDVLEILVPLIVDDSQTFEVVAITCLALGYVYVGSGNGDVSGAIVESFLDRSEEELKDPLARLMCLGMGLLFLGQGEKVDVAIAGAQAVIQNPITKYLEMTMRTCAFAGSGSVLEVQRVLNVLGEHIEEDEKDPQKGIHQEVACLGIAMIAMGESVSGAMAHRCLDHILQYGEVNVRRAVPLAMGLLSISDPQMSVIDTLSKLSHDQDEQVSQNASFALGLVGAGTNNSRIAGLLRNLAAYYEKEPNHLFLVRVAQGILHMGKGLMTLDPQHSNRMLMSKVAMAGLLTVLHASFDAKKTILADRHYLLYTLSLAIRPRMLLTVDADGEAAPVSVRVGQAVDTVGQAGKPRTITGFQTHTTPVVIAAKERAELANDEVIPFTSVLEGFVVIKPNPDASKEST